MIGFIAAMPSEVEAVVAHMDTFEVERAGEIEFTKGTIEQEDVVIALSGVGKVCAAMATTLMCWLYRPQAIVNIGVAGGLLDSQNVGDLVLSDAIVQADFDTTAIDGEQGLGQLFQADETLLALAAQAAEQLGCAWKVGTVASQDLFMAREEDYQKLMSRFPASACSEMEGGAVAKVAISFGIPVLVIRSLSDVAVHQDNPMEFSQFEKLSAAQAGKLAKMFCQLYHLQQEA